MKKILTLMFLLVSMKTFGAQIVFEPGLDQCPFIKIDGEIEAGDSKKFKNLVEQMGRRYSNSCHSLNKTIRINSFGGNVDEALLIGREARLNSFEVIVMKQSVCHSACVFVLASGTVKHPVGEVGIHRPYFSSVKAGQTVAEIRNMREQLNVKIKNFLNFVDVPESLLDEMLAYPPESMKILSRQELMRFRLTGNDATQEEINTANSARRFNLTSAEFRRRWAVAIEKCSNLLQSNNVDMLTTCLNSGVIGISESEYDRRLKKARSNCRSTSETDTTNCFKSYVVEGK